MIELYVKRWGVEVWRKERKAHYGLKDCLLRSDERVSKYLTLSTLSDNLLEIATMLSPVYASLTKQGCTPELKHRWIAIELIGQLITSARRINDNEVRKIVEGLLHPYKSTIYGYK